MNKDYIFEEIDISVEDFRELCSSNRSDLYFVAAATVIALCNYRVSAEKTAEMINVLKNPMDPMSVYEKQFLRDRLSGCDYKPYSYLNGTSPENRYTPSHPYTVSVISVPSLSFQDEGWARLFLKSSGADSNRELRLRQKKSTGEWFLVEQMLLSDIREPVDPESNAWD